jgi:hypothetical protein
MALQLDIYGLTAVDHLGNSDCFLLTNPIEGSLIEIEVHVGKIYDLLVEARRLSARRPIIVKRCDGATVGDLGTSRETRRLTKVERLSVAHNLASLGS